MTLPLLTLCITLVFLLQDEVLQELTGSVPAEVISRRSWQRIAVLFSVFTVSNYFALSTALNIGEMMSNLSTVPLSEAARHWHNSPLTLVILTGLSSVSGLFGYLSVKQTVVLDGAVLEIRDNAVRHIRRAEIHHAETHQGRSVLVNHQGEKLYLGCYVVHPDFERNPHVLTPSSPHT